MRRLGPPGPDGRAPGAAVRDPIDRGAPLIRRLAPLALVLCLVPVSAADLAPPPPDQVEVAVPRELRGLWVATVSNLDFPSLPGLTAEVQRAELALLAERAASLGFNALVFQVRPEGDALYRSPIEPWSRVLTGRQGEDPGLDPLATLIEEAHARGLEVHAWFNPYRISTQRSAPTHERHASRWAAAESRVWGSLLWLDPGEPVAQDLALAVVDHVVSRYDIDGVHLDDYFYPYPNGSQPFPDDRSFAAYRAGGGELERDAWRRQNVDSLVEGLAAVVRHRRPDCRFGISPFGIYRPGQPAGIRGLDQVATLHADPMRWYEAGWVDYLAPQLYWPTTREAQRYDRLLTWWDEHAEPSRPMIVGMDITKVGRDPAWTLDELRTQVRLAREAPNTAGQIWFRATPLLRNQGGVADLAAELYASPALPPPIGRLAGAEVAPPSVHLADGALALEHPADLRAFVLYREVDGAWVAERVLPGGTRSVALPPGTWAVSAVARHGGESLGRRVVVADGLVDGS